MNFRLGVAFVAGTLAIIAGCGRSTTVSGHVMYDGKPVRKGAISFLPADGRGPSCGSPITDGQYLVQLRPGKKIVRIVEMQTFDHVLSRKEMEEMSKQTAASGDNRRVVNPSRGIPPNAEGNNAEIEVELGNQTFDFALKPPAAKHVLPAGLPR